MVGRTSVANREYFSVENPRDVLLTYTFDTFQILNVSHLYRDKLKDRTV